MQTLHPNFRRLAVRTATEISIPGHTRLAAASIPEAGAQATAFSKDISLARAWLSFSFSCLLEGMGKLVIEGEDATTWDPGMGECLGLA